MTSGQHMCQSDIEQDATAFLGLGHGHMADVPVAAFVLHQLHLEPIGRGVAVSIALSLFGRN